jgi:hypothetical protein
MSVRLQLFPSGPPDAAPVDRKAPQCIDQGTCGPGFRRILVDFSPRGPYALSISVPAALEPSTTLELPPAGGAIWGESPLHAFMTKRSQSGWAEGSAALALWLGAADGYPTYGAPSDARVLERHECQLNEVGQIAHLQSFRLAFPSHSERLFVVAFWPMEDFAIKALFHCSEDWPVKHVLQMFQSAIVERGIKGRGRRSLHPL